MPINSTQGSFSTGRDCTIVLIGPFGQVQLDNVTNFEARQVVSPVKVDRLDGVQLNAELPKGWQGTLHVDRGSNSLDLLFAAMEANWFNGGTYQNSTMYQFVAEADSSTTTIVYDNVALRLDDAGNWKPDAATPQSITWTANRRRPV